MAPEMSAFAPTILDDVVLRFGVRPPAYASSLVRLSRSLAAPTVCASLGITRCSNLEKRVRTILDPGVQRGRLSVRAALITVTAASALALVLGSLRPALAEVPALPLLRPLQTALPALALTPSPAPAAQLEPPGSDFSAVLSQADAAAKANDFEGALALYQKAAELTRARAGDNSLQYAAVLVRAGALCRTWDRWGQAHGYYSQALAILERNFGPRYPGLGEPLSFLAMEAHAGGDLARAEALYQRVLDLDPLPSPTETALAMNGLAAILANGGDFSKALQILDGTKIANLRDSRLRSMLLSARSRVLRSLGRDDEADQAQADSKAAMEERNTLALEKARQNLESAEARVTYGPDASSQPEPRVYRVGQGVTAPSLIYKMEPAYSQEARLAKFQGTVILRVVIGADGIPGDISVVRALGLGLDEQAIRAVREWRFLPGTKDGEPVAVAAQVEVNFRL